MPRIFKEDGDVVMVMIFFEKVVLRGKNEEEKSIGLHDKLDGSTFKFFFQR